MTPEEFVEKHPRPFLVYTGGPLRQVDPGHTRGLTVDRLVIERDGTRPSISESFLVAELVASAPDKKSISIGVSSTCDITVNDSSLSKQHAWFDRKGDAWRIWDNDSIAGTQVNAQPVKPGVPHVLASGDRITMGYVDLTFLMPAAFHQLVKGLLG